MGVYIDGGCNDFKIKKENFEAVRDAARQLVQSGNFSIWGDDWDKDIKELFQAVGWPAEFDKEGNIDGLEPPESYDSNDYTFFKEIAPFVEPDSYIDIETSDFQKFEWLFKNNVVVRKEGGVDYDGNAEIVEALLTHKKILPMLIGIHEDLDERIEEVLREEKDNGS